MIAKSRALALAVATAGMIGFAAPVASAATSGGPGDSGGLVNVSHNQVPIEGCNNDVGVGVLGGGVPVNGAAITGALLGTSGNATSTEGRGCQQGTGQDNGASSQWQSGNGMGSGTDVDPASDSGGLVNISHNQVPVQVCNNDAAVGVLGGAATLNSIAGTLGILGTSGDSTASTGRNCGQNTGQQG